MLAILDSPFPNTDIGDTGLTIGESPIPNTNTGNTGLTPLSSGFQIICSINNSASATPSGCFPCYDCAKMVQSWIILTKDFSSDPHRVTFLQRV